MESFSAKGRRIELLNKWTIWTVLMPYFMDAFDAYNFLTRFSKKSRKELIDHFNAFYNSTKCKPILDLKFINEC